MPFTPKIFSVSPGERMLQLPDEPWFPIEDAINIPSSNAFSYASSSAVEEEGSQAPELHPFEVVIMSSLLQLPSP